MQRLFAAIVSILVTSGGALAATTMTESAEAERVGPMGIILFIIIFVVMSVGMVGIAFWRKGDKGEDKKDA